MQSECKLGLQCLPKPSHLHPAVGGWTEQQKLVLEVRSIAAMGQDILPITSLQALGQNIYQFPSGLSFLSGFTDRKNS